MRRAIAILAGLVAVLIAAVAIGAGGEDDNGDYRVRAIFDNAAFAIHGEDVKVAGVKVGTIADVDVTPQNRAAVTLRIDEKGFRDFRADARCTVRPQSLIGEKFVDCSLTQPRAPGAPLPPPLRSVPDGQPGEGDRLLPVENTTTPVDLDLINSTLRMPYNQRFSLLLNELGRGLAGRGGDLAATIRRANPALRETDEVLALLARQNDTLERLARDSDTVLAPLARDRRRVGSAVENIGEVAQATAERREDLAADVQRLPRFLAELRPTMRQVGGLSDQMTPVLGDLNEIAPDLGRFVSELGPFSRSATPALQTLGDAARTGTPAVRDALPTVRRLRGFARDVRPLGRTLATVLQSFQRNDGIERLMDYLFFQVAAINGFDQVGHYLRAGLIVNTCSNYSIQPVDGCTANFQSTGETSARAAAEAADDETLARTAKVLAGADPASVLPADQRTRNRELRRTIADARRRAAKQPAPKAEKPAAPPAATAPPAAPPTALTPAQRQATLLDFLLGSRP